MFSVYCGLALHHAKLYDKIRRSEQKYKVALEVLSYHNASSAIEVEKIVAQGEPKHDVDITRYAITKISLTFNNNFTYYSKL
jgi:cAMP and cAMP-inhibited cGMP 3',5'-cyclic phosphodiesterase 10